MALNAALSEVPDAARVTGGDTVGPERVNSVSATAGVEWNGACSADEFVKAAAASCVKYTLGSSRDLGGLSLSQQSIDARTGQRRMRW